MLYSVGWPKVYTIEEEPCLVHANDLDSHMPRKDTIKMSESLSNQVGNARALVM